MADQSYGFALPLLSADGTLSPVSAVVGLPGGTVYVLPDGQTTHAPPPDTQPLPPPPPTAPAQPLPHTSVRSPARAPAVILPRNPTLARIVLGPATFAAATGAAPTRELERLIQRHVTAIPTEAVSVARASHAAAARVIGATARDASSTVEDVRFTRRADRPPSASTKTPGRRVSTRVRAPVEGHSELHEKRRHPEQPRSAHLGRAARSHHQRAVRPDDPLARRRPHRKLDRTPARHPARDRSATRQLTVEHPTSRKESPGGGALGGMVEEFVKFWNFDPIQGVFLERWAKAHWVGPYFSPEQWDGTVKFFKAHLPQGDVVHLGRAPAALLARGLQLERELREHPGPERQEAITGLLSATSLLLWVATGGADGGNLPGHVDLRAHTGA